MKYRLIAFLFILVSLEVWAIINQEKNKHEEVLEVIIGDGIYISITGNDAMNMYNSLSKHLGNSMFLVSEGGMNTSHISTPVIHCQKTDPNVYGPPRQDNDPSLYLCDILISSYGTVDTH